MAAKATMLARAAEMRAVAMAVAMAAARAETRAAAARAAAAKAMAERATAVTPHRGKHMPNFVLSYPAAPAASQTVSHSWE